METPCCETAQHLRQANKRDLAKQAENLANIFRDYIIPIVPLVTDELDTVTDAFVRINSQGKGMTEAHMLRALTHLDPIDTDQYFAEVLGRLEAFGWGGLDQQILVNILKCMLGLDVYGADVRHLRTELRGSRTLGALGDAVEQAVAALLEIRVRGPSALPYAYQLVAIAAIAAHAPDGLTESAVQDKLQRWFWVTTYGEHFTGMTGSGIRQSIEGTRASSPGASSPARALFAGRSARRVADVFRPRASVSAVPRAATPRQGGATTAAKPARK